MQQPSVGRIVHYILPPPHKSAGVHCAAIIVAIDENEHSVTLKVWGPDGTEFVVVNPPYQDFGVGTVAHDEEFGAWHWPERVL